jgi:hypothetical protein
MMHSSLSEEILSNQYIRFFSAAPVPRKTFFAENSMLSGEKRGTGLARGIIM